MAKNITRDSDVEGAVEEAPRAIPSAQAWTTKPIVVAEVFLGARCGGIGVARGVTASLAIPFKLREEALWGPRWRFDSDMCMGWYFGLELAKVSGRWSTRNMRMYPRINATPMKACGLEAS
jgi:hypothetical protein